MLGIGESNDAGNWGSRMMLGIGGVGILGIGGVE